MSIYSYELLQYRVNQTMYFGNYLRSKQQQNGAPTASNTASFFQEGKYPQANVNVTAKQPTFSSTGYTYRPMSVVEGDTEKRFSGISPAKGKDDKQTNSNAPLTFTGNLQYGYSGMHPYSQQRDLANANQINSNQPNSNQHQGNPTSQNNGNANGLQFQQHLNPQESYAATQVRRSESIKPTTEREIDSPYLQQKVSTQGISVQFGRNAKMIRKQSADHQEEYGPPKRIGITLNSNSNGAFGSQMDNWMSSYQNKDNSINRDNSNKDKFTPQMKMKPNSPYISTDTPSSSPYSTKPDQRKIPNDPVALKQFHSDAPKQQQFLSQQSFQQRGSANIDPVSVVLSGDAQQKYQRYKREFLTKGGLDDKDERAKRQREEKEKKDRERQQKERREREQKYKRQKDQAEKRQSIIFSEKKHLQERICQFKARIDDLEKQLQQAKKSEKIVPQPDPSLSKYLQQNQQLHRQVTNYQKKNAEIQMQLDQKTSSIVLVMSEVDQIRRQLFSTCEERDKLKRQRQEMKSRLDNYEKEISQAKARAEASKKELQKCKEDSNNFNQIKCKSEEYKAKYDQLKHKYEEIKHKKEQTKHRLQEYKSKYQDVAKGLLNRPDADHSILMQQIGRLQSSHAPITFSNTLGASLAPPAPVPNAAILESQLAKSTSRLQEQNKQLKKISTRLNCQSAQLHQISKNVREINALIMNEGLEKLNQKWKKIAQKDGWAC